MKYGDIVISQEYLLKKRKTVRSLVSRVSDRTSLKLHQLNEELKERNYKMELTFETIGMSYWDFDV